MRSGINHMRRMKPGAILGAAALGILAFAGSAFAQSGVSEPKAATTVFTAATASGDLDALMALYAPDAVLLPQGQAPIVGGEAIKAAYQSRFELGQNTIIFGNVRSEMGSDRAAVFWQWQTEIAPEGGTAERTRGHSLVYFKLVDDAWLISFEMRHDAPAP